MVCLLYPHINLPSAIRSGDEVADGQGRQGHRIALGICDL